MRSSASPGPVYDRHAEASRGPDWSYDGPYEWVVSPDDRAGPPLPRRRLRAFVKGLVLSGLIGGGGWAWYAGPPDVAAWVPAEMAALVAKIDPAALFQSAPAVVPAMPAVTIPAPLSTTSLAEREPGLPPATAATADRTPDDPQRSSAQTPAPAAPVTTASLPPVASAGPGDASDPAPPGDPLRAKAEGVGLHPDLSRALLLRLSDADYRNAGAAVTKATTEMGDAATLIHPRKRTEGLAQFKVHFVPGAAQSCRRYVVTIAKDGWQTTALPVEKCGGMRKAPTAPRKG